jgi:hypothetical protein
VRADLLEHDKLVNEKIEKIVVAQQAFFEQQKEHERKAEEREVKAAARAADSERLSQQVQMQVGQIALSMNGVVQAIGNGGGLRHYQRAGRAEADSRGVVRARTCGGAADCERGRRRSGGVGEGFAELRALC